MKNRVTSIGGYINDCVTSMVIRTTNYFKRKFR